MGEKQSELLGGMIGLFGKNALHGGTFVASVVENQRIFLNGF